tara:strand:+ start:143 stop:454 length:312 start_codon:yes stop_codon:yes gene_type:complete
MELQRRYVVNAMQKLNPSNGFSVEDTYETLQWHCDKKDKPTKQEFNDAVAVEKLAWSNSEYARKRQAEYPDYASQLDEIFHNGLDSWKAVIQVTKDKYPKPTE